MPSKGVEGRALQMELLAALIHKQRISPAFTKALGTLVDLVSGAVLDPTLSPAQTAALREWRRDYLNTKKLPVSFVKTFAKTTVNSMQAWASAKAENDFRKFTPHLQKIVSLSKKKAELLGYKEHPYDALLDLYEPGMTVALLTPLFARLKNTLSTLLKAINASPPPKMDFLHKHCDPSKQMEFGHLLLQAMGFDKSMSRLDLSSHPFCIPVYPTDTRMTTRVHPNLLMSNIFSVIHEGGHGLYNLGFNTSHYGSPLAESISLGFDESQSRWWETLIGRSRPFWEHFYPLLQRQFPENLQAVPLNEFHAAINRVKASMIRTEADEVTYSLHIIVRFELERALIEGSLQVKEIPEAWNSKMQEYLGISPSTDAEGCLQDIHWSMGGIGYFPTYTLGNLYASQLFTAFQKNFPNWHEKVAKGDLDFIRTWLHTHIHQYGKQYTATETMVRLTGEPLTDKPFIRYLEQKYSQLYKLKSPSFATL